VFAARGINVDDLERVSGARSFHWSGRYEDDMTVAHTLDTQLNVFADFDPQLSGRAAAASTLFLANIQPDLQRRVSAPVPRRDARRPRLDELLDRVRPRLPRRDDARGRRRDAERRRAAHADRRAEPGPRGTRPSATSDRASRW
jgi:hypothetical protein